MASDYLFRIPATSWTNTQKSLFRVSLLFLLLLTIPTDAAYYQWLFSPSLHFQDLYHIGYATPSFFSSSVWGAGSFAGWVTAFLIAVAGAFIWAWIEKQRKVNYDAWYYWFRVVLRYRLAVAAFSAGLVLALPLQLPYPTISDLHTAYGDFLPWKIYYHSTAVATAGYRQTIGILEILAGVLLLYRRTVAVGALLFSFILVNIVLVNFAYELGEHLYSLYLLLVAVVLLLHDFYRLYAILSARSAAFADRIQPLFGGALAAIRYGLKAAFTVFVLLLAGLAVAGSNNDRWPYPNQPGLANTAGFYQVSRFAIDSTEYPYSFTDTIRWQDVVFEQWNTISIRTAAKHLPSARPHDIVFRPDSLRNYESIGNGGRVFYRYQQRGDSLYLINSNDTGDHLVFAIERTPWEIKLNGHDAGGHYIRATLNKVDKQYLLYKGRRKPVTIY